MAESEQTNVLSDTVRGLRPIFSFSVLLSLIYGLLRLAGPLFMILVFDRVLPSQSVPTLISLLFILVIIISVMTLLDYSRRRILARFGAQFQERVEDHIFSATKRDAYFAKGRSKPAAGLNEADQLRGFFHSGSLVNILDFLWSPVFLAVVFVINPFIGWVVMAGLVVLALINFVKVHYARGREERYNEASDRVGNLKDMLLVSRHVVERQQMVAAYNKRWTRARRRLRDMAVEHKDFTGWFSTMSTHTTLLLQYLALATAAYLTIKGELTVGSMVAAMVLTRLVANATERFLKQVPSILEARRNWRSLDKTLSAPRALAASVEGALALRLSQVTVRCPVTKNKLLRNVTLEVLPGSSIEIVGGSGSGKTVLAEMLIGRFPRSMGKVQLGAINIERLSIADAAKMIGYVPQVVDFVSGTIEENIAGLEAEPDRSRLVRATRLAQMHEKIMALPEGYLTNIDAIGSLFSKSERHGIALARALFLDPKLLIVDEPDTGFRDALSKNLKNKISDFLARGGILITLTRVPLKTYRPTRSFTLDGGLLRETEPVESGLRESNQGSRIDSSTLDLHGVSPGK